MEIPNINIRVKQIIDLQTNGNVKKFAESINISQQTINRLFNIDTRTNKYPLVTTEILISITEMYVHINSYWLLTGNGEMILDEKPKEEVKFVDGNFLLDRLEKLAIENHNLKKDIEQLKNGEKSTINAKPYIEHQEVLIAAEPKKK